MGQRQISQRAAGVAVAIAFAAGLLGSLALRPAGPAADDLRTPGGGGTSTGDQGTVATTAFRWRMPVAFGTNLPALGDNALHISATLAAISDGAMVLDIYEPTEIVPPFEITDAVSKRKVQAGYTWLGYDQGRIPASPLLGAVPFGMEPWEFTAWWYEAGGRELGEELYHPHGVHPVLCGLIGPETAGWFRRRIETLDDIKGLKIRFAGLGGKVLQRAGASITMLPGGEIFQALEKGAIDATEYALPVVDRMLGFDRVAPYNYYPGWHQPATAFHLVINLPLWERLDAPTQALIETVCTASVTRNLARSEALQGAVIADFIDQGASAVVLSPEILQALAHITEDVMREEAESDPAFARILASQKAFRAEYAHWKARAYLPRDF
jgi:TRAP-type mannitol/chloroaromatic compound transport system substrate-binding protein